MYTSINVVSFFAVLSSTQNHIQPIFFYLLIYSEILKFNSYIFDLNINLL